MLYFMPSGRPRIFLNEEMGGVEVAAVVAGSAAVGGKFGLDKLLRGVFFQVALAELVALYADIQQRGSKRSVSIMPLSPYTW